jgi:hypothetical protein
MSIHGCEKGATNISARSSIICILYEYSDEVLGASLTWKETMPQLSPKINQK